jgi:hypothetical protein
LNISRSPTSNSLTTLHLIPLNAININS